jgi:protein-disulfide isomerase
LESPIENPGYVEPSIPSPASQEEEKPKTTLPEEPVAVLVIPRVVLNYFVIGVVMLALGGVIGYQVAQTTVSSNQRLIEQAVNAALEAGGGAAEETARLNPNDRYDVSVDDDPFLGPEDAPITIIEFSDFKCPYCGRFHEETFSQILADYEGQIRFVYRDYPILGQQSLDAALASECADDQGVYWQYHDLMFANHEDLSRAALIALAEQTEMDVEAFTECFDKQTHRDEIVNDYTAGYQLGITGTPAFFVNGKFISGAQPYTVFASAIEAELQSASESTPEAEVSS